MVGGEVIYGKGNCPKARQAGIGGVQADSLEEASSDSYAVVVWASLLIRLVLNKRSYLLISVVMVTNNFEIMISMTTR